MRLRATKLASIGGQGSPLLRPSLDLRFADGHFSNLITFTRASTATFFNSSGVLTSAAADQPRFDYNPSTLAAQGLLIEEARTNSIRNNTMVGAAAGTPGTPPTNWSVTTSGGGVTREIVGTGTESGITYIDIRVSGTTTAALFFGVRAEIATQIAAANGQTWTSTFYVRLVAGSLTNITLVNHVIQFNDAAGAGLTFGVGGIVPTTAALNTQRFTRLAAASNASTAFVQNVLQIEANSGVAIDITLRIGLPQLEQGAFATSVIPTVNAFALGVTRSADVASVNTLSPWFNAAAGTLFNEVMLYALPPTGTFPAYSDINDGTATNRIALSSNQFANHRITARNTAGILIDINAGGSISVNVASKWALAYANADYAASANGGAVVTSATAGLPSGLNQMLIGRAAGANQASGYLRRITYYPRRLSNAELVSITS